MSLFCNLYAPPPPPRVFYEHSNFRCLTLEKVELCPKKSNTMILSRASRGLKFASILGILCFF